MAQVIKNEKLATDIYRMILSGLSGHAGQFFMLQVSNGTHPLLKRPLSIYDRDDESASFVYRIVGEGTKLLSKKRAGDEVDALGPFGNGFPLLDEDVAIIGGGIGIAPLYLLVKEHRDRFPNRRRAVYLGYCDEPFLANEFKKLTPDVIVDIGGYITDRVDFEKFGAAYACGPEPMLCAAAHKAGVPLYISMERHMACGVGACLGCTVRTSLGNRRVCKEGPVFLASEVYDA